ncbi:MAG: O-antigen ligase family protein [Anaerolineales bacterium]|nr:O-antigen ligase family protein [Anaerolineales bacterium]
MIQQLPFADGRRTVAGLLEKHKLLLLRTAVIFGVLAVSVVVGRRPTILFVLPIPAVVGALLLTRYPGLGLPLIVLGGILVPFAIGTGTGSEVNAGMLMIMAVSGLWILDMVRRRDLRLHASPVVVPLFALLIVNILSFIAGQLPWFTTVQGASLASQIGGVMLVLLSVLSFLWVGHAITDVRWIERTVWLFLILSALYVVSILVPNMSRISHQFYMRGVYTGSLFWTWMMALAFGQVAFNRKLPRLVRGLLILFVAATFYYVYVINGDWKSGWIPPLIAVGVVVLLRWPRLSIGVVILSIFPMIAFVQQIIQTDLYSYSTRVDAWVIMAEIIKVNPILGLGPSNYYFYTPLFPIRGYYVQFNSHNQYVDIIAQTGLLGMGVFIWFAVTMVILSWDLTKRAPEGFPRGYVFGTFGGLVATLVAGMLGDWIIPFVYNVGFDGFRASMLAWLFLGGLLAMDQMWRKPAEE